MYAVLKTGGKQYKVAKDDIITVEKLAVESGSAVDLNEVLMIGDGEATTVGTPLLEGAKVIAEVLEQKRGKKIIVFKKKRRKNYRRTQGHRQNLTVLRITEILADGKKAAKKASKPRTRKKAETTADGSAQVTDEATESKE
ncbi:MAG: 50S ribosomal protein L21 [Rhodospirillaceae bacterium]|nr:50S ribosomal protein L21 [Rhodospirillaceae bacterium]